MWCRKNSGTSAATYTSRMHPSIKPKLPNNRQVICDIHRSLFSSHKTPISEQFSSKTNWRRGSSRLYLAVGLITGGAIAIYHYTTDNKPQEISNTLRGVVQCSGIGSVRASCHEGNLQNAEGNHQGLKSAEKFESAIKRSRDLLQRAKDEVGSPGIAVAVSVDGKTVWSEGIGYADVENRAPLKPDSIFRIASISKSLTMTAVARLWEDGKLDLDKPVQEYVPSFPQKEWDAEKVVLTTRHLVSHLGGIRHYDKSYMKKKADSEQNKDDNKDAKAKNQMEKTTKEKNTKQENAKDKTQEKKNVDENLSSREWKSVTSSLNMFKDDPLMHKPGSKYVYTTHGWTLISAVVEGAAGQDYLTYMNNMLTDMGLTETMPDKHHPIIYNRARGYHYNKNGKLENTPYVDLSYKWAGGGYLSSLGDLLKFGNAMLYSYQYSANQTGGMLLPGYLKPETMQAIWKPIPKARAKPSNEYCYAMGWSTVEKPQTHGACRRHRHLVAHSGGAVGFSSILVIAPPPPSPATQSSEQSHEQPQDGGKEGLDCITQPEKIKKCCSSGTIDIPPKGIVVAMYVNLSGVSLSKAAGNIVEAFQQSLDQ